MILQWLESLYKYCCFRYQENRTKHIKTEDEQIYEDMKILLQSFNAKMERMRRSRLKCC